MDDEQTRSRSVEVEATLAWVRHAVVGLNLCPFAKAPHARGQIRCVVSAATDDAALLEDLAAELRTLAAAEPDAIETTLVVHPQHLADFLDFNDFLDRADALLRSSGLEGTLQIAPFHPHFQFADSEPGDIANATNRAPYPTLHLLREASIDRAVAAFPEAEAIFETNIATLESLGHEGWAALQEHWLPGAAKGRAGTQNRRSPTDTPTVPDEPGR